MELKKSDQANIDKLRVPITLIGLLFVGSIVLASFSYQEGIEREANSGVEENSADIEFMQETQDIETPPPPPPVVDAPPPVTEEIIEEENTEEEPGSRVMPLV